MTELAVASVLILTHAIVAIGAAGAVRWLLQEYMLRAADNHHSVRLGAERVMVMRLHPAMQQQSMAEQQMRAAGAAFGHSYPATSPEQYSNPAQTPGTRAQGTIPIRRGPPDAPSSPSGPLR